MDHPHLSARSIAVLEMIAAGNSYDQILAACPALMPKEQERFRRIVEG